MIAFPSLGVPMHSRGNECCACIQSQTLNSALLRHIYKQTQRLQLSDSEQLLHNRRQFQWPNRIGSKSKVSDYYKLAV